jgi:hypothetical protein
LYARTYKLDSNLSTVNSGSLTQPDIKAPMNEWIIVDGSFATLRECEQFRTQEAFPPLRAAGLCLPIIIWGDVLIVIGAVLSAFGVAGFVLALAYTYYGGEIPKVAARVFLLSFVFGFGLLYSVLLYRSIPKRESEIMAVRVAPEAASEQGD